MFFLQAGFRISERTSENLLQWQLVCDFTDFWGHNTHSFRNGFKPEPDLYIATILWRPKASSLGFSWHAVWTVDPYIYRGVLSSQLNFPQVEVSQVLDTA